MLRLEFKLGQPDRALGRELSELADKDGVSLSNLKQAATAIITTRAKFDDMDKILASNAVKFAVLDNIPVEQSADLSAQLAYDLELGSDALDITGFAWEAAKKTPNLKGITGVQLVVDMKPYWNQVHRLTGRTLKEVVLEKGPIAMTIQKVLYALYPGDPALANRLLRGCGLSSELLEDGYAQATSRLFSAPEWASIVDRFQRGETDVIANELRSRMAALEKQ
jgi:hypothetical protein